MLLGDLPSLGVKRTTEDVKYVMNKFWTALDEGDVLNPTLYAHSKKCIYEICWLEIVLSLGWRLLWNYPEKQLNLCLE